MVDESDEACYIVQRIDSLLLHSDTHQDDSASSSNDDHDSMDAHALNDSFPILWKLSRKIQIFEKEKFLIKRRKLKFIF